jgi:hypothetical protein
MAQTLWPRPMQRRSYRCHHTRPPSGFARPGGIRQAVAALPHPRVPPCASAGTASTRISQGTAHGIFRCCFFIIPSSLVSSDTHHSLKHFPYPRCPRPGTLSTWCAAASSSREETGAEGGGGQAAPGDRVNKLWQVTACRHGGGMSDRAAAGWRLPGLGGPLPLSPRG